MNSGEGKKPFFEREKKNGKPEKKGAVNERKMTQRGKAVNFKTVYVFSQKKRVAKGLNTCATKGKSKDDWEGCPRP